MTAPVLRAAFVGKRFGKVEALSNVSFDIHTGEIHALVGENGAGKSTLINILAGVLTPDAGAIEIDGRPIDILSARHAQQLGIATVFQELSVALPVSIAENIFAGRLPWRAGFVDWKALHAATAKLMESFGMALDPETKLADCAIGIRQLVEIAKALSLDARILLLDEPTSALDQEEKEALFAIIRKLAASGIAIVYISHHLNEVFALSDRVTVIRDGRVAGCYRTSEVLPATVIQAMVGKTIAASDENRSRQPGAELLVAANIVSRPIVNHASLTLRAGEIVALAGLIGSGRSEFVRTLCGLAPLDGGSLELNGKPAAFRSLRQAMARGIAYVPGERKTAGLFLDRTVSDNIAAAMLAKLAKHGIADPKAQDRLARRFVSRLGIKLSDIGARIGQLSGGNQQKSLLAKWLATEPSILIVEEPTRGVDVGARQEIHRLLHELAESGMAILVISSDLPEVMSLAHRIVVMRHGATIAELDAREANEETVMALASGLVGETRRAA